MSVRASQIRDPVKLTHDDLVRCAHHWLRHTAQCCPVSVEATTTHRERVDAIGWCFRSVSTQMGRRPPIGNFFRHYTHLVECKVSHADFLADAKKPSRVSDGAVGNWRWFLTPRGVITPPELPKSWGLIEVVGNGRMRRVVIADFVETDEHTSFELALQEYRASQLIHMEHTWFTVGVKPDLFVSDARTVIRHDAMRIRKGHWAQHWWEDISHIIGTDGYGI